MLSVEAMAFITPVGGLLSAVVTAVATIFLWRVTSTLAHETKRLAEAGAQPQVVASIEPNQWIMFHADYRVDNTGNATAYDININFDPPIPMPDNEQRVPFQHLSVLKPGQGISTHLTEFKNLFDTVFTVTVSWRRNPAKPEREANTYKIDLSPLRGMGRLGAESPIMQIAQEVKHIREDWKAIANGSKRLTVDVHTSGDRLHERRRLERMWRRQAARVSPQRPEAPDEGA